MSLNRLNRKSKKVFYSLFKIHAKPYNSNKNQLAIMILMVYSSIITITEASNVFETYIESCYHLAYMKYLFYTLYPRLFFFVVSSSSSSSSSVTTSYQSKSTI